MSFVGSAGVDGHGDPVIWLENFRLGQSDVGESLGSRNEPLMGELGTLGRQIAATRLKSLNTSLPCGLAPSNL
jgi:hypothetical protein